MSIELQQIGKRYGDARSPLVVKDVDLRVPKGTLTTILGPSGCGKTTLLRMIAGLDAPSSGRILIDGQDVTSLGASSPAIMRSVVVLPQPEGPRIVVSVPFGTRKSMPLTTSGDAGPP